MKSVTTIIYFTFICQGQFVHFKLIMSWINTCNDLVTESCDWWGNLLPWFPDVCSSIELFDWIYKLYFNIYSVT